MTLDQTQAAAATRLVQVDMTRTMLVRLPEAEARAALDDKADHMHRCERVVEWLRIAHHDAGHIESDFTVRPGDETRVDLLWPSGPEPVDAVDGKPSYLWSARHFVGQARYELSCGRYREGRCPELDEVNTLLGRLEERLRLMALAADGESE